MNAEDTRYVEEIAHLLRHKKWTLFKNNCYSKAFTFRGLCRAENIPAKVLIGIGIQTAVFKNVHFAYVFIHARGWVDGKEYEVANPRDYISPFGTNANDFVNIVGIWI